MITVITKQELRMFKVSEDLPDTVHKAARLAAEFLIQLKEDDVRALEPFTYYDGEDAWTQMLASPKIAHVHAWYPFNRWTKAIATTFGDGGIHINARKVHLFDVADYVNTLTHETMHNVGFGHGNNFYTEDKARSVPYAMGALAEAWVRSEYESTIVLLPKPTYRPWWKFW